MPDLPAGPYRIYSDAERREVPFYVIPFDKKGYCTAPETRRHLVNAIASGAYSHVILFSHGWNNDWTTATKRYENFIEGFGLLRQRHELPAPLGYSPLLVGIFWPSTALVIGESEVGPDIAAVDPSVMDREVAAERLMIDGVADQLTEEEANQFYALMQKDGLDASQVHELASLVAPLFRAAAEEGDEPPPTADELVASWRKLAMESASPLPGDDFGVVAPAGDTHPAVPLAAGLLEKLDPRPLLRAFTVWTMKDRAGVVGARGVGPLLADLLTADDAHVHLVGHSYGAKVMLSALCVKPLPRKVESALLLQAAVSHLCFAPNVPGSTRPGGYHDAPNRVRQPILATFSKNDVPLTKTFHLALRRGRDLGEAVIAALTEPPSRYAALGGFGPRRCSEKVVDILDSPQPYALSQGPGVVGLRGDRTIGAHGDISNDSTWWALYTQVAAAS